MVRYTYADLYTAIESLNLTKARAKALTNIVIVAERAGKQNTESPLPKTVEKVLLKQALVLLELYKNKGLVTKAQFQKIERIINSIINL